MRYRIVKALKVSDLEEGVNLLMDEGGWVPTGGCWVSEGITYQAMTLPATYEWGLSGIDEGAVGPG